MSTPLVNDTPARADLKWAFPIKRESAYGTAIGDSDINKMLECEGFELLEPEAEKHDNREYVGRGHDQMTSSMILRWKGDVTRALDMNPLTDGLLWSMGLGNYSVSTVDTGVYLHSAKLADLASVGRVPSSISLIEEVKASTERAKIPGVVVSRLQATIGRKPLPKLEATLRTAGNIVAVGGGYSFPALSALHYYEPVNMYFEAGPWDGSFVDISQIVHQITPTLDISFAEDAPFIPGGKQRDGTKGQVADTQIVLNREISVEVQVYRVNPFWSELMRDNTPLKLRITCFSDDVISGSHKFMTRFTFNCLDPQSAGRSEIDGGLQGQTINFISGVFGTATQQSAVLVEVQNDIPLYLEAAA